MRCLLLVLIFSSCGVTSHSDAESLKKYSYSIVGLEPQTRFRNGSGYFIRNEGRLFFVTAKHVMSGCYSKDSCVQQIKLDSLPNNMNIILNNEGRPTLEYFTIPVTAFRDSVKCNVDGQPDIYVYEITYPPRDTIYSVEGFLSKKMPTKKGDFIMYGFPYYSYNFPNDVILRPSASLTRISNYSLIDYFNMRLCDNTYKVDSIDFVVQSSKKSVSDSLYGYSGSPAFVQDRKSKRWIFLGTFHSNMENDKFIFVKPEIGLTYLK